MGKIVGDLGEEKGFGNDKPYLQTYLVVEAIFPECFHRGLVFFQWGCVTVWHRPLYSAVSIP